MKAQFFLKTSRMTSSRLTDVFDFVWPTAAAIWNLRWQVAGFVGAVPKAGTEELLDRFVAGSGIHGANLRRSCLETGWDEQRERFARVLLFELCAIYEAWCEGAVDELGISGKNDIAKWFQFQRHSSNAGNQKKGGDWEHALKKLRPGSGAMASALLPQLLKNRKNSSTEKLDGLLVCYRYFKEARNSLIHGGGSASEKLREAESAYVALKASDLGDGVKEKPAHRPSDASGSTRLDLRGVVGFADVVLRLVATIDAELAKTAAAEDLFVAEWRKACPSPVQISTRAGKRKRDVRSITRRMEFLCVEPTDDFVKWLADQRLVT